MDFQWNNIQDFSGVSGVGALCLFAILLLASAFADNLPKALNSFAKTALWSIIAAIPLIAISYVVGLLSIGCAEQLVKWACRITFSDVMKDLIAISSKHQVLLTRYQQLLQEHEILAGSSLGFLILAISAFVHAIVNIGWRRSLTTAGILSLIIAIGGFILSGSKLHDAAQLLQLITI